MSHLNEALSKVAADCAYVKKDGRNDFHKYNYATAATIFEKVNEALNEHGLLSVPHFNIHEITTRQNKSGGTETLATVECTLSVVSINPDPNERTIVTRAYGSGMDNGDKAIMKAQTAALKYAWVMLLNISTGDDPEADSRVDARMAGKTKKAKAEEDRARTAPPRGTGTSPSAESCPCGSVVCPAELGEGKWFVVCWSAYLRMKNAIANEDSEETLAAKGDMKNHFHRVARPEEVPGA